MKRIIFCLLIAGIFQQCTNELHEIDSVISSQIELKIADKDVPRNSFSAFYVVSEDEHDFVQRSSDTRINHNFKKQNITYSDLGVYWIGDFDFESGDYEMRIKSDEIIKVILDNETVFEGTSNQPYGLKTKFALKGIHRLKVLYNMTNEQKVQKIIEYYQKLNEEETESESEQKTRTSVFGSNSSISDTSNPDVKVTWKRL